MCEWYANGKPIASLSRLLGVGPTTIYKYLNTVYLMKIKQPEILVLESKINLTNE